MIANPPQSGECGQNSDSNHGLNPGEKRGIWLDAQFLQDIRHEGVPQVAVNRQQHIGEDQKGQ